MITNSVFGMKMHKVHLLVGLFILLVSFGLLSTDSVSAHASLLSSTPADGEQLESAPGEVVLDFSEPVGVVDGGTTLHRVGSDPMELSPRVSGNQVIIPLDLLDEGSYIVQWRVISADAHPISGTVSFAIGDAEESAGALVDELPGRWDWARSAAVGIKYLGLLSALGVLLVGWAIVRSDLAHVTRLSQFFAIIGLAGIFLELPLAAVIQKGMVPSSISGFWNDIVDLQTNTLTAAAMGVVLTVLTLIAVETPWSNGLRWRLSSGLMVGAVLTLILNGHSRTREPEWLMMLSDSLHVIVGAIWLGGIILLATGLRGRWRGDGFSSSDLAAVAVSRFSMIAGYTAALVALSGVVMAVVILDSVSALYRTDYGIALLIKIGLVVAVAVLAGINRFTLIPKINMDASNALSSLRRLVTWELVLLIAVVAVTGNLVHSDPNVAVSTSQPSAPVTLFEGEEPLDSEHTLRLTVKSNSGNQVTVVATIIDEDRNIVLPDAEMEIDWILPEQNLGPISQSIPIDSSTGAFHSVFSLPAGGEWDLEIRVNIDRFTDSRTTIEVVVPD